MSFTTLSEGILNSWRKRSSRLSHNYGVAGYALSVLPEIRAHSKVNLTGEHRILIEEVITRLHSPPCPNSTVASLSNDEIIDIFWAEYRDFVKEEGVFKKGRFQLPDAINGNSHVWHETYSVPHTRVLGFVACRVCSKRLGIGAAERSWSDVKSIKCNKRSNLGGESLEKRAILYTTARLNEAKISRDVMGTVVSSEGFGDDDLK